MKKFQEIYISGPKSVVFYQKDLSSAAISFSKGKLVIKRENGRKKKPKD